MNTHYTPEPVRWRILAVLLVVIFMTLVDVSIVNVAVPAIQQGLGASAADIQWVLSGYALTFGVILVAAGRAGDIAGRGGLFIIGLVLFVLSSLAAGLAPEPGWLVAARFVQGIGSGLVSPQGLGMIQQYFRGAERGRAFGYLGSAVGVSVAVGPVLGGVLIKLGGPEWGWRLAFLVNLPVGLFAIALALKWFPKPLIHWPSANGLSKAERDARSLDPIGSVVLGLAVLAVLFPFVETRGSAWLWLLLPLGVGLALLWVWWERRYVRLGKSPMVDLNIFATRSFSNGIAIMALYFLGMTSIWVLVALYLQDGLGKTALQTGLVGAPAALISAVAANWAGKRVMSYGRAVVIVGFGFAIAGLVLSMLVVHLREGGYISVWWLACSLALVGVAQGLVISPNQTLSLAEVPLQHAGSSGAIMQTGQRMGTSIGIALITAAVFGARAVTSWSNAMIIGLVLITLVVFLALGVAIKDYRDRQRWAKAAEQVEQGIAGVAD